jgi:uncharacterized SAM-binding protein YcdF (DUF218 family)
LTLAAGVMTAGVFGLAWAVDRFGQVERARRAPVIIVLGARVLESGGPSGALRARVEKAVSLRRQGLADLLLFSGGVGVHPPAEAVVARDLAISLGVPASACLVEMQSHSTAENARYSTQLLRQLGIQTAILVSDPYHLLRAQQYFRREGLTVYPSPALQTPRNLERGERAYWTLREALALVVRPWLLWSGLGSGPV